MLRPRTKKLIGLAVILAWLPIYILLGWSVGLRILPHAGIVMKFVYYAIAGISWIIPIGLMLPWMARDPRDRSS
ncbi:MAG: DUF2842 domain-containing protein [Alphaproteobacteria bacterium]